MKNLIFLLLLITGLSLQALSQNPIKAKVVGVVSGDTITVLTKDNRQLMIHLDGIDAPDKEQDFGGEAKQFLSSLVLTQSVTISNLTNDCLKRPNANVSLNGKDLSLAVIKTGNAWADSACQQNDAMTKAESSAREKKIGLWQNSNPVQPAEFRKIKESQTQAQTVQNKQRKIFSGLAPTPPPIKRIPTGIYAGMGLNDFLRICGKEGKKSQLYTSSRGYQSFTIDYPETQENNGKGCSGGRFSFERMSGEDFILDNMFQSI